MSKRKPLSQLSYRHQLAVSMYCKGYTKAQIADRLQVNPATITRWFKEPAIVEEIERIQEKSLDEAEATLRNAARTAARYLEAASDWDDPEHGKAKSATGVRAAVAVLDRVGLTSKKEDATPTPPAMDLDAIKATLRSIPKDTLLALLGDEEE